METPSRGSMSRRKIAKLSISAQFDDICRLTNSLAKGVEGEFTRFVEIAKKFKHDEEKDAYLNDRIENLNGTVNSQKRRIKVLETQLKHAKSLVKSEMDKTKQAYLEKRLLDAKIQKITQLLLDKDTGLNERIKGQIYSLTAVNFDTESLASSQPCQESSDSVLQGISFDNTAEDPEVLEQHPKYKPFTKPTESSISTCSTSTVQNSLPSVHDQTCENSRCISPTCSDPRETVCTIQDGPPAESQITRASNESLQVLNQGFIGKQFPRENMALATAPSSSSESYTSAQSSFITPLRKHSFTSKPVSRIENCLCCNQRLNFHETLAMCLQCKAVCHNECKVSMPVTCLPISRTSSYSKDPKKWKLTGFAPLPCPPEISNIMQCIKEIDRRGLHEVNLYHSSAPEKEVKNLIEMILKRKRFPRLKNFSIHVICETMKYLLKTLNRPLISKFLWAEVVSISENQNFENKLAICYYILGKLPKAHLATVAVLIMHLHRVAKSTVCRINYSKLSDIFGSIILGSSLSGCRIPPGTYQLKRDRYEMMHILFSIPTTYWELFVSQVTFQ